MDISIIIVNYNTAAVTCHAIDSVLQQAGVDYEIIVADNASQDGSVAKLQTYGSKIKLLANADNLGFGKANNQAFMHARGRYLCLFNPDSEFENPDDLAKLVAYMDANPKYGLIGARILDPEGTQECIAKYDYPGENHIKNRFNHLPGSIAWVLGAIMVVRREVYQAVNGFDEDYFVYGEDADLCLRIRKAGHEIGYCQDVTIRHIGGATSKNIYYYNVKTRKQIGLYIFYKKHYKKSDMRYLIRIKKYKAFYRLTTLILPRFLSKSEELQTKYLRYKAIYDLSGKYLREM